MAGEPGDRREEGAERVRPPPGGIEVEDPEPRPVGHGGDRPEARPRIEAAADPEGVHPGRLERLEIGHEFAGAGQRVGKLDADTQHARMLAAVVPKSAIRR